METGKLPIVMILHHFYYCECQMLIALNSFKICQQKFMPHNDFLSCSANAFDHLRKRSRVSSLSLIAHSPESSSISMCHTFFPEVRDKIESNKIPIRNTISIVIYKVIQLAGSFSDVKSYAIMIL